MISRKRAFFFHQRLSRGSGSPARVVPSHLVLVHEREPVQVAHVFYDGADVNVAPAHAHDVQHRVPVQALPAEHVGRVTSFSVPHPFW